jgi:hypothetical protein
MCVEKLQGQNPGVSNHLLNTSSSVGIDNFAVWAMEACKHFLLC